jgi:hypothetical protein
MTKLLDKVMEELRKLPDERQGQTVETVKNFTLRRQSDEELDEKRGRAGIRDYK